MIREIAAGAALRARLISACTGMRYRSSDAMLEYGDLRSSGSADPAAVNIPMSRRNRRQARVPTVFVFMVVSTVLSISTGCSTIPENGSGAHRRGGSFTPRYHHSGE